MKYTLWIIRGLLAVLFVFAGVMKFITPVEEMTKQMPMSGAFLHFIGAAEILGGLGLVLPGMLKMMPVLSVWAAAGLFVIMAGAVVVTLQSPQPAMAAFPLVVGLLLLFLGWQLQTRAKSI